MELISVVVPVYNVEKYLAKCVASLLEQTHAELEIILVDDGSTDSSGDMCDALAEQDGRIRVIHKQNGGLSDARNAGMAVATGEYISFVDSDDFVHARMFEILLAHCQSQEAEVAIAAFQPVYGDTKIWPDLPEHSVTVLSNVEALERIFQPEQAAGMVIACSKLYKRSVLGDITFPLGKVHEDEYTTYRFLYNAKRIVHTSLPLYYYLQRSNSIMGEQFSLKKLHALDAFRERTAFFEAQGLEHLASLSLQNYLNNMIVYYMRVRAELAVEKPVLLELEARYKETFRANRGKYRFPLKEQVKNQLFYWSPAAFPVLLKVLGQKGTRELDMKESLT